MIDERADSDWANLKAVAPFTGAWIEILHGARRSDLYAGVAPFTGAWIEISDRRDGNRRPYTRRTLHGCVD